MNENNSESSKKLTITLGENISSIPSYEVFFDQGYF